MAGYISVKSTAMLVMILLGLTALAEVLEIVFSASQYSLLDRAAEGLVGAAEAEANDTRIAVLGVCQLVLLFATAAAFVTWMSRAHRNLYAFGMPSPYSPAQVGWAFFIPFVNLVRPLTIVKLIWQGSVPVDERLIGRSTQVMSIWWGTWIVSGLFERVGNSMSKAGEHDIATLKSATMVSMISAVIRLVAAAMAIRVVDGLTQRQESCASGQVAQEFD
jgi:hypothetical protein